MSSTHIDTHGNWQYLRSGEERLKRRVGTTQWERGDSPPPDGESPVELKLVRQDQSPGEPYHWSLFVAREEELGALFQVKGDALAMHYAHAYSTNVLNSQSYKDSYIIAQLTEDQTARVRYWASHETAPRAQNQAAVMENCQGWTVRVIQRLVAEGIVQQKWLDAAVSLQQPVK